MCMPLPKALTEKKYCMKRCIVFFLTDIFEFGLKAWLKKWIFGIFFSQLWSLDRRKLFHISTHVSHFILSFEDDNTTLVPRAPALAQPHKVNQSWDKILAIMKENQLGSPKAKKLMLQISRYLYLVLSYQSLNIYSFLGRSWIHFLRILHQQSHLAILRSNSGHHLVIFGPKVDNLTFKAKNQP